MGARSLAVVAAADVTRLTPAETADLARLAARVAVWAAQRRDDVAVALADHAAPVRLPGPDGALVRAGVTFTEGVLVERDQANTPPGGAPGRGA